MSRGHHEAITSLARRNSASHATLNATIARQHGQLEAEHMHRRRDWLRRIAGGFVAGAAVQSWPTLAAAAARTDRVVLSDDGWRKRLTPAQYDILRREGTERAGTSALNGEKRKGTYLCVGCDLPLFTSAMKFDSGTGWPSFFTTLPDVFGTKSDRKFFAERTEYHCARCDGHHGHVFDDGPVPTGKRYCNNGLVLKFVPEVVS
jgi:peptide-methionine (R)-S-oxide reductase